ncbi:conserved hypothetical protein [metagenome]
MPRQRRFEDEISKIESERVIQMMESELEYHRKMSKAFESSLVSEQEHLSRITRRQQMNSQVRNNVRNTFRQSRGDDLQ